MHAFATVLNEKQGVNVVISVDGGRWGSYFAAEARIKRVYSASRTLLCLETNYWCAFSKIDFICLRSQTRPPFSPLLSLWHFKLSQLSSLSSFALLRPSHPAPFNICFICLSHFSLSKAQRKSRHIFQPLCGKRKNREGKYKTWWVCKQKNREEKIRWRSMWLWVQYMGM